MSIKYNNLENMIGQYLSKDIPWHVYIHIPFCRKKCHYCDFYSIPIGSCNEHLVNAYIEALIREIDIWFSFGLREVITLYIGGGTPSILTPQQLEKLLEALQKRFLFNHKIEFTVEVNPDSIDKDKLNILDNFGVNRLSIGIQSFNDEALSRVGRVTRYRSIISAMKAVEETHFENINIDIIMGIQDEKVFKYDLEMATGLLPTHISVYMLHLAEGTSLFEMVRNGEFSYPEDDYFTKLYLFCVDFLNKRGYSQYEISNFSLPGFCCLHNLNYWGGGDYIGMGAGGVSTIGEYRIKNQEDVTLYISRISSGKSALYLEEILDDLTGLKEKIMLSFRTNRGIYLDILRKRLIKNVYEKLIKYLSELENMGFLKVEENRVYLTPSGFLRFNALVCEIFHRIEKQV